MPVLTTLTRPEIDLCDRSLQAQGFLAPNRLAICVVLLTNPALVREVKGAAAEGNHIVDISTRHEMAEQVNQFFMTPGPMADTITTICEAGWVFLGQEY